MLPFPVNNILGSRSLLIADVDAVARVAVWRFAPKAKFPTNGNFAFMGMWGCGDRIVANLK